MGEDERGGQVAAEREDTADAEDLVDVRLEGLPLRMFAAELRRHRDLLREFALIRIGELQEGSAGPHHQLLALVAELERYRTLSEEPDALRDEALRRGEEQITLTYRMPRHVAPMIQRLIEIYEQVDDYTRTDRHLLTLPPSPEAVALRRWYFGEFVRQAAGEAPQPWTGPTDPDARHR